MSHLQQPGRVARIDNLYSKMPGELPSTGLVIRNAFSYREGGADIDASDRKAPPRASRPPATRLATSRGSALQFALTLLSLAQMNRTAGKTAHLSRLNIQIPGTSKTVGWADMVSAEPEDSHLGGLLITARNKRARTVRSALETLAAAGLVLIPGEARARNRFEDFVLLNEAGIDAVGEAEEYAVPTSSESTFGMPAGFITNGWLHLLEDSEIALLLMVACRQGGWPDDGLLAVPAEIRLRNYGIHRDPYSSARKTLEWFGLLRSANTSVTLMVGRKTSTFVSTVSASWLKASRSGPHQL